MWLYACVSLPQLQKHGKCCPVFVFSIIMPLNKTKHIDCKKGNEVTEIKRARVEENVSIVDCYDKYCSM